MSSNLGRSLLLCSVVLGVCLLEPRLSLAQSTGGMPIFRESAKLQASDPRITAEFGYSVAIDGDTLIVGAAFHDLSGSAYVFERTEPGTWSEVAKLRAIDPEAFDDFGWSVAVSGGTVVVGVPDDDDLGGNSGSAYVYERDELGAWRRVAKLLASDGASLDDFGDCVAVSGETIVVGAYGDDDLGTDSGSTYVFERDESGMWNEVAKLLASDGAGDDRFGGSVAISGETMVMGAGRTEDNAGAVYVFERNGAGRWTEVAKLLASDGDPGDGLGGSVGASGDVVVAGARLAGDLGYHAGSAYVFERDESGTWSEVAKLLAPDGDEDDFFGDSVAVSGGAVVVGAFNKLSARGLAYLFRRDPSGAWSEAAPLSPSDGAVLDEFGFSVAISGGTAVAGAPGDDDPAPPGDDDQYNYGSAYVFAIEGCVLELRLDSPLVRPGDELRVTLYLEHNRVRTVTVPFVLWVEDEAGGFIAGTKTRPLTFHHGDTARRELTLPIPDGIPPGRYQVMVGIEKMEQGIAEAKTVFRVVDWPALPGPSY